MAKKTNNQDSKTKALNLALSQIEKQFGKGAIMRMGEGRSLDVSVIPTGIYSLDDALGAGGLPRGRAIEIYGPEGSGKTTLTLSIIAQAQTEEGVAAFIDAEHSFDPKYAKLIGVNLEDLLISQPDTGEQALDIVEALVRSNAVDLIVIDSVAALVPKAEIEGQMGDSRIALQARLMSQAMRKLTAVASKSKTCIVFINQIREKVGVMFGSPEVTPGGRALKFYSSVRIDLRKRATLTTNEGVVGMRVRAKIVKNKVAPPFREAMFEIMYDEGVSKAGALIDAAMEKGVLTQSGSWFSLGDENIAQGKEKLRKTLKEDDKLKEKVEKELAKVLAINKEPEEEEKK
ncbi:MAG: recombinase RecA [Candidatus Omnitrophica bacterium]|nr:recombinase RecA [Candidatus Omnitrophota bacterium]MCF7887820.1 recombinase RecA [Candidatus Omnitrophota bacterium]